MTVVTRGLRAYHVRHGAAVPGLRVNMPINLRTGTEDANGGNRWVPAGWCSRWTCRTRPNT